MTDKTNGPVIGACTIISPNYFPFARTLSDSYLRAHPGHMFYVLVVAKIDKQALGPFEGYGFRPVALAEIGITDLTGEAMKYDILELNTNVKPTFLKYLLRKFGLDVIVYLDPDIFVYQELTPVFLALDRGSAVLTPHMTSPVNDSKRPTEQDMLCTGTYNLGFIALKKCKESDRLLDWWEERCLESGFDEPRTGLFVDQKWMNLAPGFFQSLTILRHVGCNMAYWNLHERTLTEDGGGHLVNGDNCLCFFHFSGISVTDPHSLSKYTNRFSLSERQDLQALFRNYKKTVTSNQSPGPQAIAYGFDVLSDGTAITRIARRIYANHKQKFAGDNPFDANGRFANFAKRLGLFDGKLRHKSPTWQEFNPKDMRVQLIHAILRVALKTLGANRYELLMRYLSHITVLREQYLFLDEKPSSARPTIEYVEINEPKG